MKQCTLRRGNVHTVSWIPSKYAIEGKYIKLKDVDGWLVEHASKQAFSSEYILSKEQENRNYVKNTDI